MSSEKFIESNLALVTLIAASLVVFISLSVRQVFGMFFMDFNADLGITNTEFGLAIGIQMLGWGLSGPVFGAIADKYGGHKAISLAFVFYIIGIYFLYNGPNTGIYFQVWLGVLILGQPITDPPGIIDLIIFINLIFFLKLPSIVVT